MSQFDRRTQQRELRAQLDREFPDFELLNWYIQFRELKAAHPDTVLLYRLGDFYETFDDDAKLVAELLEVTLTYKKFANHRRTKAEQRAPMAGMPYHAIERYVSALVGAGYRVAIAEQTSETPSSKSDTRPKSVFAAGIEQSGRRRDIVDREVVRVITPGTVIDSGMLPAAQNNYLAALIAEGARVGLAYADLSTGEFCCTEFAGDGAAIQAQGELARLQAVEVLVADDAALRLPGLDPASARLEHDLEFMTKGERELLLPGERVARHVERENTARWAHGHLTAWPSWRWKLQTAADALLQQLRVRSLDGFGLRDKPLAVRAAGAVIQYIHETQRGAASQIASLRTYTTGGTMFLDPQTRRNLELLEGAGGKAKGSLVGVLDQTRTPMGARLLRRWLSQPLLDIGQLVARQDGVAHFVDDALTRATVRERLRQVGDLERAVNRVIQGVGVATPRDMVRLREALRALPALAEALVGWAPPGGQGPGARGQGSEVRGQESEVGADRVADGEGSWWVEGGDDAVDEPQTSSPKPQAPSLRERREAKRRVAARYDDDLFGEEGWDDEPVDDRATGRPGDRATEPDESGSERVESPPRPLAPSPTRLPADELDPCSDVLAFLEQALDDDPPALLGASNYLRAAEENGEVPRRVVRPGFDADMDLIVEKSLQAQIWINQLEPKEQELTGIRSLRVDYNKVFGYYIEVPRSFADKVPSTYVRKQTLVTGERYITPELKEYEDVVLRARERLAELEQKAFARICAAVAAEGPRLLATARALAEVDVYAALAEAAVRGRYVRPVLRDDARLRIAGGRHPVVEQMLDEPFIPNDATLDTDANQVLLVTGPNMAGKCVSGDTLVFTDRGLVPIVDLMPESVPEGEFTEMTCQVRGLHRNSAATHFYRGGRKATVKLTTRMGYQIEGTPEHRVWVRHPDGSEGWKLLGDIVRGDIVAIERQIDLWGQQTKIDHSIVERVRRAKQYRLPDELNEDLAYCIGLLIGDGTLTYSDGFILTTHDTFIADEFRRIVKQLFDYEVRCRSTDDNYAVGSKQIRAFLASLGVGHGRAHEKYVPQSILMAPKHIVIAFLQGLFDTDGYANKRYGGVQLATAAERLAHEVQLLLLNLGIIASLRVKQTSAKPSYQVSIYGTDAIAFHQRVGFRLPRKQARQELASPIRMPNIGGIPYLKDTLKQVQAQIVATIAKPVALKHNKSVNSIFYTYIPNGRNISYTKLDELINYCRQSAVACSELEELQTKRYFYDPITIIDSGEAEVYDLSVEVDHAYVANGFVSHNSTCLRQVALIVLMAQIGSFVPADAAEIGLVDRIFTRIGAQDDIATGQSTFMVEMIETAALLVQSTRRSLIILDEVGRGTSTYDGMAIARAVVEYIHNEPRLGCRTLFATHYHELTELEQVLPRVKNYHMAAVEQDGGVVFLHELRRGGADRSYGIHVAELAGIPRPVIRRASELLAELERGPGVRGQGSGARGQGPGAREKPSPTPDPRPPSADQIGLFDLAPSPVIEMLRRLNVNELSPIEALTKLYELQRLANQ